MRHHTLAALFATGDELAIGQSRDTNSADLAAALLPLGIRVIEHVVLPDDELALAAALSRLAPRVDLILTTGGLGPTADDLTRPALARALGEDLVEDPEALARLEAFFRHRNREMPPLNRVQALRPRSARTLPNPHGTAPGLHALLRGGDRSCDVFCLPGPPREMRPMLRDHVLPALRPAPGSALATRVIPTCGLGESVVAQRLGEMMRRDRDPLVGTTASGGIVSCRLRSRDSAALDRDEEEIRRLLGPFVIGSSRLADGTDAQPPTLAGALLDLLRTRSRTLALAESCTGGLLAGAITAVPGASDVFLSGWVTYANASKRSLLGVGESILSAHGAVSAECALAMARGAIGRSGASDALAVTGIAGPSGGTPEKPVGLVWIARASREGEAEPRTFHFGEDRETIRERAVVSAMNLLRLRLQGAGDDPLTWEVR